METPTYSDNVTKSTFSQLELVLANKDVEPSRSNSNNQQMGNLKLEGEHNHSGEYKSEFVEFPLEKCHSIPQISSIKFQGDFIGIPSEYMDCFKGYDHFAKSAPVKKADNLNLIGYIEAVPEYRDKFKEPNKEIFEKSLPVLKEDGLRTKGEFSKVLPEYFESFKNYNVTVPEKAKCKETFFKLNGYTDYNPEYRCTYLDFPRSRPITKKPLSNFQLTHSSDRKKEIPPSYRKNNVNYHHNIHDPPPQIINLNKKNEKRLNKTLDSSESDIPLKCQPEYRKAKMDYMIRERTPGRREENNNSINILNENKMSLPVNTETRTNICITSSDSDVHPKSSDSEINPGFRLLVENVDEGKGTFRKDVNPKYGRRASNVYVDNNNQNIRTRTKVVESNPNYVQDTSNYYRRQKKRMIPEEKTSPAFIVLNEPCKQSAWMKPSWYDS